MLKTSFKKLKNPVMVLMPGVTLSFNLWTGKPVILNKKKALGEMNMICNNSNKILYVYMRGF